jgi:hypothetical protein
MVFCYNYLETITFLLEKLEFYLNNKILKLLTSLGFPVIYGKKYIHHL